MSCVIVTCYRSEASGIYMECVVVVVMVDNGWETVEHMVDVMVFLECWDLVWWVGGPSINLSIMEYGIQIFFKI